MRRMLTALLLCALLLPVAALAGEAETGDQWVFHPDAEGNYFRVHTVMVRLQEENASLRIYYTIPEERLQENPGKLEDIVFYIMPDAKSAEIPPDAIEGRRSEEMEVVTGGDQDKIAGQSYVYTFEWQAEGEWPETFYIRPYYRELEGWGEALELPLEDAEHMQFTPMPIDPNSDG